MVSATVENPVINKYFVSSKESGLEGRGDKQLSKPVGCRRADSKGQQQAINSGVQGPVFNAGRNTSGSVWGSMRN